MKTDLELRQLRVFVSVVESGAHARAARALGVSQSTISETLSAMERTLGTAIFRKSAKGSVLTPAGPEKAIGMISTGYLKDPTDHQWDNDAGMKEWRDFMAKHMPGADLTDANLVYGYAASKLMWQVLKQCNGNFSRTNVMKQAESVHDLELPTLLPGIKANTSHTDHRPIKAMRLERWNGKTWELFGDIIEASAA